MKKLRVGIIGCGGIANQKHLPSLKASQDLAEIVAFCDIKVERAERQQRNMAHLMPGSMRTIVNY